MSFKIRNLSYLLPISLIFLFLIFFSSCLKESFITDKSAKLEFSTDTLLFDTVFVTLGSSTKHFMVYNPYNKSLKISEIRLARGDASPYRINIDGEPSTYIKEYTLLPNDSIYIFVDVTIDPNKPDLLYIEKDSVTFLTNGNYQDVKLMAWGQDAHFYHDSMLPCNTVWNNDKPYVISNHIGIAPGCKLTINPGVKIYSDNGSGIFVWGTLETNGTVDEPIEFKGLRLEEYYKDKPGQWYGIRFLPRSYDNYIKNTSIRNATIGVEVDSSSVNSNPNLTLENVIIENMSAVGVIGYSAHIVGYNCLVDNCCRILVVGELGGTYSFYQSSFSHSTCQCLSNEPAMYFNNSDYNSILNPLKLSLINSIIYGGNDDELVIEETGQGKMELTIDHNVIKTKIKDLDINGNILNEIPKFKNPCNYNFELDTLSPAKDKGIDLNNFPLNIQTILNYDLKGESRTIGTPDLGAYERIE